MQRQVTRRAKKAKPNEWGNICTPDEWQKLFEIGHITEAEWSRHRDALARTARAVDQDTDHADQ